MPNEQLSLRVDADLLKRVDEVAKRAGMSRTQIVERSLEYAVGRTELGGGVLPAGLTPQFQAYLESIAESGGFITLLVLDPTGRQAWTFSGAIRNFDAKRALESGFVTVMVYEVNEVAQGIEVPIARASVVAWQREASRSLRHTLGHLWRAIDGNDYVARFPKPIPVPRL